LIFYFDGAGNGRVIAVAADGQRYEQSFVRCSGCHSLAMVLKPLEEGKSVKKHCHCSRHK